MLDDVEIEGINQNKSHINANNNIFIGILVAAIVTSFLVFQFFESWSAFRALQWILGLLSIFFYFVTFWSDFKSLSSISFGLTIFCSTTLFFTMCLSFFL